MKGRRKGGYGISPSWPSRSRVWVFTYFASGLNYVAIEEGMDRETRGRWLSCGVWERGGHFAEESLRGQRRGGLQGTTPSEAETQVLGEINQSIHRPGGGWGVGQSGDLPLAEQQGQRGPGGWRGAGWRQGTTEHPSPHTRHSTLHAFGCTRTIFKYYT